MALVLDGNGTMTVGNGDITGITAGAIESTALASGTVLQVVMAEDSGDYSTTSSTPVTVVSASITPTRSSSKILILATVGEPDEQTGRLYARIFRNTTSTVLCIMNAEAGRGLPTGAEVHLPSLANSYVDTPNTTSSTTYFIGVSSQTGGNIRVGNGANHRLILLEIAV